MAYFLIEGKREGLLGGEGVEGIAFKGRTEFSFRFMKEKSEPSRTFLRT